MLEQNPLGHLAMNFKRLVQFRIAHILVVTTICAAIAATLRNTAMAADTRHISDRWVLGSVIDHSSNSQGDPSPCSAFRQRFQT